MGIILTFASRYCSGDATAVPAVTNPRPGAHPSLRLTFFPSSPRDPSPSFQLAATLHLSSANSSAGVSAGQGREPAATPPRLRAGGGRAAGPALSGVAGPRGCAAVGAGSGSSADAEAAGLGEAPLRSAPPRAGAGSAQGAARTAR